MPQITSSVAPNGLPIHRVSLDGTRATTILVAFDAGARTERPDENGMAHFLEHLVFKGGQKYDDYRKVNQTAETMGARLVAAAGRKPKAVTKPVGTGSMVPVTASTSPGIDITRAVGSAGDEATSRSPSVLPE